MSPSGEYPELTKQGVPKTGTENFGGPTVTAGGLVFCSGTLDPVIRAFDKDTGAELWSGQLPWTGSAPPSVYEVNGKEFVVISATGGGKIETLRRRRLCSLCFALELTLRSAGRNSDS